MLWFVLTSLAVGLPVAVSARALLPGRRPLSLRTAAVLGVLGALAGAAAARVLLGGPTIHPVRRELAGPLLGAVLAVLAGWGVRAHTYRSGPRPPRPRPWTEPFPDLPDARSTDARSTDARSTDSSPAGSRSGAPRGRV